MSGHSKWSTIKRKKEVTDAVRGKLFSKLSKTITIAAKTGGGSNPETNYRLKSAIDTARNANMPKANIDRAIKKLEESGDITEVTYEALGPNNVNIIIEVATDNKNRTFQQLKLLLERGGGQIASPGAVTFNFEKKGFISIKSSSDHQEQMLSLIDLGVEDMKDVDSTIEIFTDPKNLTELTEKLKSSNFDVKVSNLTMKPVTKIVVEDQKVAKKVVNLLEVLEDHEDVQNIYTNVEISDELLDGISSQ